MEQHISTHKEPRILHRVLWEPILSSPTHLRERRDWSGERKKDLDVDREKDAKMLNDDVPRDASTKPFGLKSTCSVL